MLGAKCGEGAAPVLGEQECEIVTQRVLELRADRLVVVDDQQFRLVHGCRAVVIGSLTVNVVPTPSLLETSIVPRFASTTPSRSTALGSIQTNGINRRARADDARPASRGAGDDRRPRA